MLIVENGCVYEVIETGKSTIKEFKSMVNVLNLEVIGDALIGSTITLKITSTDYQGNAIKYNGAVIVKVDDVEFNYNMVNGILSVPVDLQESGFIYIMAYAQDMSFAEKRVEVK